jgi:hypothetical protein
MWPAGLPFGSSQEVRSGRHWGIGSRDPRCADRDVRAGRGDLRDRGLLLGADDTHAAGRLVDTADGFGLGARLVEEVAVVRGPHHPELVTGLDVVHGAEVEADA